MCMCVRLLVPFLRLKILRDCGRIVLPKAVFDSYRSPFPPRPRFCFFPFFQFFSLPLLALTLSVQDRCEDVLIIIVEVCSLEEPITKASDHFEKEFSKRSRFLQCQTRHKIDILSSKKTFVRHQRSQVSLHDCTAIFERSTVDGL